MLKLPDFTLGGDVIGLCKKNWLQPVQLHLLGVLQPVHVGSVVVLTFLVNKKTSCSLVAPKKGEKTRPDWTLKHYIK